MHGHGWMQSLTSPPVASRRGCQPPGAAYCYPLRYCFRLAKAYLSLGPPGGLSFEVGLPVLPAAAAIAIRACPWSVDWPSLRLD